MAQSVNHRGHDFPVEASAFLQPTKELNCDIMFISN